MPRLKPPPAKPEELEVENHALPTEPIEIELPGDDSGATEVDLSAKPSAKPAAETKADDDNPLQKALDAQKHAEELQRTAVAERDAALRQARDRDEELTRERGGREDAEYNSVLTAIAAEQAALDKAEADAAAAAQAGDWQAAMKAQRLIGTAAARLDRLEDGKQTFETRREASKTAAPQRREPAQPAAQDFEQRIAKMPPEARDWLRKHPEFINDAAQTDKIGNVHNYLVHAKGLQQFSEAYFDALDTEFGFKAAAEPAPKPQPQRRSMPMSAPVSRDVPSASGQRASSKTITLSPEEVDIARKSIVDRPDMTPMTNAQKEYLYAQNKQKLLTKRANGEYRQTTEQTG